MNQQQKKSPISLLGLFIWFIAALFFLYEFFLRTFVGSVEHQVMPALHLNAETFAIVGAGYYIAYAVMQIPVGILADKFGVKRIMLFATLMCAVATFLFAHSEGFLTGFASRFLMGFGSSFAFVCLLVIALTWFPKKYFGFFAGLSQFIGTMGPLLAGGPLIALMLYLHESWRMALTEIAGFGVILAVLVLFFVKSKPRDSEKKLIFLEQTTPLGQRILNLAKNKQAWLVALYSASVYGSISLIGAVWGTGYLETRGLTQAAAADKISLAWLGYAIGCPLLGALSDMAKRRKPVLILCALLGILVTSGITYLPLSQHYFWLYGLFCFCLGIAAAGQNVGFAAISEHAELANRATALGLNNAAVTLFGAIVPLIVSFFISLSMKATGSVHMHAHDFIVGFSFMPIINGIALITSVFFIHETYCKPRKEMIKLKRR